MNTAVVPIAYKDEIRHALLDALDFWLVLDRAHQSGNRWRGASSGYVVLSDQGTTILLHRFLMGLKPGDGVFVDHINRDPLDNRRHNLRVLTPGQSTQNLGPRSNNRTGYRGVMTMKTAWGMKYQARITVGGQRYFLGTYDTPEAAAQAAGEARARHAPYSQEAIRGNP